jgi:PAS domain S-box-containing protein/diguanylate cyclase (GGDEF)-like protein
MLPLYLTAALALLFLLVDLSLRWWGSAAGWVADLGWLLFLGIFVAVLYRFIKAFWVDARSGWRSEGAMSTTPADQSTSSIPAQPQQAARSAGLLVQPSDGEARCRAVINSMVDVAFQTDGEGRWTFLNPSWEQLTGFTAAGSIGRPFLDSVHPDEILRNQEHFENFASGRKETCWYDTRFLTADGGFLWMEVRARPEISNTGALVGVTGTITDINQRKLAEESLRASGRAMTTLLDRLPGMLYRGRNDRDWTMEYVSDGCFELTAYEACDFVENMKTAYVDLIHPEHRDQVWHHTQTALTQNQPYDMEYRIITQEGKTKWVWEQGRGVYSAGGELLALEGSIIDITARKQEEEEARQQVFRDPHTGLCNRATFEERLDYLHQHSKSIGYPFLLIYLDLDNFNQISERFGDKAAQRVIVEIGRRLLALQRPANTTAWLGGDKFAVLVSDLTEPTSQNLEPAAAKTIVDEGKMGSAQLTVRAMQITEQLQRALSRRPVRMVDGDINVTASAGIAVSISGYEGGQGMLQSALEAAHRAKFLGSSHITLADSGLYANVLERRTVDSSLAGAFSANALRVRYQPVVSLDSRSLAWVDAVMYWHHPRRGLLEFKPSQLAAEDMELLAPISRWLLREICRQKKSWLVDLAERCPEAVCVNLPAACLSDPTVIEEFKQALQEYDLSADCCMIEAWHNPSDIPLPGATLLELRHIGARLVMDGETLMMEEREGMPNADVWRVDLARVQREQGTALLGEMVAKAKTQGAIAVISGIKNEDALAMAQYYGFTYGVGSLFCEPVSHERINQLILGGRERTSLMQASA